MQKGRTIKIFLIALVLVLAAAISLGIAWFLIGEKGNDLKENMQVIRDREALDREQFSLQAILDDSAADREQLRLHILEGEDGAVKLLSTVDEVAAELGITLETKSLEVIEEESGDFDTLEITFNVSGGERSVMKMLQLLELLPYRSEVIAVEVTRERQKETGVLFTNQRVVMHASIVKE